MRDEGNLLSKLVVGHLDFMRSGRGSESEDAVGVGSEGVRGQSS